MMGFDFVGLASVIAGIGLFVYLSVNSPLLYSAVKVAFLVGCGLLSVAAPVFFLLKYLSDGSVALAIVVAIVSAFPAVAWYAVSPAAIKRTLSSRANFALWRPE